jgi:two-component system, cell cycle sensor histidine kinase and response regulator CckA
VLQGSTSLSLKPVVHRSFINAAPREFPEWLTRLVNLPVVSPDYIFSTALDSTILWANPAAERLLGSGLAGRNADEFRPAWVRELLANVARPAALRDGHWIGQTALHLPDGSERPVRQILVPHRQADGSAAGYSMVLSDLTEHVSVAERLRAINDTVPVGVFCNDRTGRCDWVNATYCAMTGRTEAELLGDGWRDVLVPDSSDMPARALAALEATGRFGPEEVRYRSADGAVRIASVRIGLMRAPDGSVSGQVGVVADITHARAQQDALRTSEERFRAVLDTIEEGIVMQDAQGRIILSNPGAERILGLSADQMRGVTSMDPRWGTIDTEGRPLPGDQHPAMVTLRTGRPVSDFVMGVNHPERERVWIRINALPITLPGTSGESGVVATFVDVTQQRQAEAALRASEQQLRAVTDAAGEAICLHDADGTFQWVSEGALEVLGWEPAQLLGTSPYDRFHPDDIERIRSEAHVQALSHERASSITYRFRRQDGSYGWVETSTATVPPTGSEPARLVTTTRSADSRLASEARAAVRQRLGGVTHFAGRLAHDFTNLYTVLQSRLELMRDRLEGDVRQDLEAAFEAIDRATELTRALRALGGREAVHLVPTALDAHLHTLAPAIAARFGAHVVVAPSTETSPLHVLVDHEALDAILIAIVRNAIEAASARVEVTLQVERVVLSAALIEAHAEVPAGEWAVVRCRDNGPGIDDEMLAHIFEPEFSSKGEHVETGLGLPVALARMQRMLGHLSVARLEGGGTEVSLWLPVAQAAALARSDTEAHAPRPLRTTPAMGSRLAESSPASPAATDAAPDGAHVLLIDDDLLVLRTAERLLERAGFRVTTASSGFAARELLAQDNGGIEVIITDVVMPGMSGPQLIAERRTVGDQRPVVYMSGYTGDAMPLPQAPEADALLVSKPFTSATLIAAIRQAMAQSSGAKPRR